MITKSDWRAVHQEMMDDEGQRLGEPPTAERMQAYSEGMLSEPDAEQVRAWLAFDPELARAVTEPFPEGDANPGDPGFLSQDELATQWGILQNRLHPAAAVPAARAEGRVLQFRPAWLALAAAIALVFAGLYVRSEWGAGQPHAAEVFYLSPDGVERGGGEKMPLSPKGDAVFVLPINDARRFDEYRIEMTDLAKDAPRQWSRNLPPSLHDISVVVPHKFLKPGEYRIVTYGISGGSKTPLDSYTVPIGAR